MYICDNCACTTRAAVQRARTPRGGDYGPGRGGEIIEGTAAATLQRRHASCSFALPDRFPKLWSPPPVRVAALLDDALVLVGGHGSSVISKAAQSDTNA